MDQISMFSSPEPHAKASASPDSEVEWMTSAATSLSDFLNWLNERSPAGSFGKMSPEYCHPTEDGTLVPSSGVWANSGMGSHGQSLMLSMPAWRNGAAVCLLSDILETGTLPQQYYLTKRACDGILRRAENRGSMLPESLYLALKSTSAMDRTVESKTSETSAPPSQPNTEPAEGMSQS